jgi:hypothetical protein
MAARSLTSELAGAERHDAGVTSKEVAQVYGQEKHERAALPAHRAMAKILHC